MMQPTRDHRWPVGTVVPRIETARGHLSYWRIVKTGRDQFGPVIWYDQAAPPGGAG